MKIKDIVLFDPKISINIKEFDFINYIETSSVVDNKILNYQFLIEKYPSSAKKIIKQNDILISKVRPNLNHNCIIKESKNNLVASSAFIQIRVTHKLWNPKFIYYFLTSHKNIDKYISNCTGTIFPTFNKNIIENINLPNFSHQVQQHIVNIIHLVLFLIFL